MKYYYLRKVTTVFVDPHGDSDDGGIDISVVESKCVINTEYEYKETVENWELDEDDLEDFVWGDDDELQGSEDGYNSTYEYVTYSSLTQVEAEEYRDIIKKYKELFAKV